MARIVRNFDNVESDVMAFLYQDGSAAIEVSYYAPEGERVTLFNKIEISPEGVRKLLEVLGGERLLTPLAADENVRICSRCGSTSPKEFVHCGACGYLLAAKA